ncbi:helix-turn-helix domain-containing protein [Streptomyces sp. C10-9-1]|uniref:helix-turn-helix domain-containing protein n=1 Tax=Streptomyces sp. C10-9-1 TaxID=1859285 RepID=UPI002113699A|nr:helix-turn-helix domain-containing protein [Streptomyces sp. C10-9-1]MCQ6553925.1 helix-turn-helix domain-containing protein [Streptomyces sp. C10-9-1]
MPAEPTRRVLDPGTDTAALKALTHPLRIRLLGLLRQLGAATASELAARTGESSASTSYHLRVLARHGFITEAEHRDARERRWQAVHALTSWDEARMNDSEAARAFVDTIRRAQLDHLERTVAAHAADAAAGRVGADWLEASGMTDLMLRMTPESLGELVEVFTRTAYALAARDADDPRAEQAAVFAAGFRMPAASGDPEAPDTATGTKGGASGEQDGPAEDGRGGAEGLR